MEADLDYDGNLQYQASHVIFDLAKEAHIPFRPVQGTLLFLRASELSGLTYVAADNTRTFSFYHGGFSKTVTPKIIRYSDVGNTSPIIPRWSYVSYANDFTELIKHIGKQLPDASRRSFFVESQKRFHETYWSAIMESQDLLFGFNQLRTHSFYEEAKSKFPLNLYRKVLSMQMNSASGMAPSEILSKLELLDSQDIPYSQMPTPSDMHAVFSALYLSAIIRGFGLELHESLHEEKGVDHSLERICLCRRLTDVVRPCMSLSQNAEYHRSRCNIPDEEWDLL